MTLKINIPFAETQLAKRLYRLPKEHKSVMLQLLNKCEYINSQSILQQHIKNADSILEKINNNLNCDNLNNNIKKYKLPTVKKRYMFIYIKTAKKFTLEQVSRKFGTDKKTIYRWIYNKNIRLYKSYHIVREII